ncbi:MAG TPA: class I SAM-dependent methyltransferase [Thermoanaerobaculia bacterium]
MTKQYDRAYFDKWYRSRNSRVNTEGEVRRKVTLAVAAAEYFLHRPIRTVLDVGCGEGAWLPHLRELRPRLSYTGLDASDYVVERFGRERNIRKATFGDLPSLRLGVFDLVVCSDVMHYVPNRELRAGMETIANATDGVAYLEVLTAEDDIVGDLDGLLRRPASWYRKLFRGAGLRQIAPYTWLGPGLADGVAELEGM